MSWQELAAEEDEDIIKFSSEGSNEEGKLTSIEPAPQSDGRKLSDSRGDEDEDWGTKLFTQAIRLDRARARIAEARGQDWQMRGNGWSSLLINDFLGALLVYLTQLLVMGLDFKISSPSPNTKNWNSELWACTDTIDNTILKLISIAHTYLLLCHKLAEKWLTGKHDSSGEFPDCQVQGMETDLGVPLGVHAQSPQPLACDWPDTRHSKYRLASTLKAMIALIKGLEPNLDRFWQAKQKNHCVLYTLWIQWSSNLRNGRSCSST